jgi:hypothetical protein
MTVSYHSTLLGMERQMKKIKAIRKASFCDPVHAGAVVAVDILLTFMNKRMIGPPL